MAAAPDTASSAEDLEQHFFPGNELLMSRPAPYRWGNISSSFCLYFVLIPYCNPKMNIQLAVPVLFYNVKKTFRPCFSTNPAGVRDTEMSAPSKKGPVDRNPDVDGITERNRRRSCRGSASSLGLVVNTCLPFLSTPRFFVFRSFLCQELSDCRSVVSAFHLYQKALLRIRIRKFLSLPDPDPLV
jgi:hypothetical protein